MWMCLRTSDVLCNIDFKPRRSRSEPLAAASPDDARERILAAAQRCIDRHGIRKTTWSPHVKAQEPIVSQKPGLNPQPNSDFRSTRTLAHRPGRQGPLIHQMKTECFTGNPAYSIRSYWSSLQAGSGRSVGANAPRPARGIDNPRPIVAR